ncbi:DUF4123 domain-containing protein [Thalassospira sp. NFXS8]|uniref:DUF4123 domain-containing protein n=1 Tax=Thalassospira sp. NFXS8 TaxID=2819093 RepID=UPI0032DFA92E
MSPLNKNAVPWLGHCQFLDPVSETGNDTGEEIAKSGKHGYVAVWTDNREGFDAALGAHLAEEQVGGRLNLLWSEDVMPATGWMARNPGAKEAIDLARQVHDGHPVEIGPLAAVPLAVPEPVDWLKIEDIDNIEPLGMQMGTRSPMNVPGKLENPLFGQPTPSAVETRAADGDIARVPPMRTYAILDAAKMPYLLTGHLENSGLRYQSLFQGAAQKELTEQAPYLVELKEDSRLTRTLFTGPNGICGLWDKDPGIYIRSRAPFDDIRRHFRKFTRIRDATDKWYYFRFWESGNLSGLATRDGGKAVLGGLLRSPVSAILARQHGRPVFRKLSLAPHTAPQMPEFRHLDASLLAALDDVREENIRTSLATDIAATGPNGLDLAQAQARIDQLWIWLKENGMRDCDAIRQAASNLAAISPEEMEADHRIADILTERSLNDNAKARLIGRIAAS